MDLRTELEDYKAQTAQALGIVIRKTEAASGGLQAETETDMEELKADIKKLYIMAKLTSRGIFKTPGACAIKLFYDCDLWI